ncbi:SMI1/KNR4 family protein [Streptomyces sp. NPDC058807]|uniref:SMI1/KNR4 family protein n=1 Tax=unclassified Streptomyces TaxID=2593676 RepID=UPI0036746113
MNSEFDSARVADAWPRIVRWLEYNTPVHAEALNLPATEEQITAAEKRMGVRFPLELRTWLLMNNGSTALREGETYATLSPLPQGYAFMDLDMISGVYAGKREYQRQMKCAGDEFMYWAHNWIPVIQAFDSEYGLFLDASEGGAACPVYSYGEDDIVEVGHTVPSFSSLGTYLTNVADALEGTVPWGRRDGYAGKFPVVREGTLHW